MSDTTFRELFIELPRAVFETLQGIGEAAVRAAEPVPSTSTAFVRPSAVSLLLNSFEEGSSLNAHMAERLGWRKFTLMRSAMREEIEVRAVRWCGHRVKGFIDEMGLHASPFAPGAFLDALAGISECRWCTCMRRED